jgi:hypothetical protein
LGGLPDSCGSPLNPVPTGVLRLPSGKYEGILTEYQTKDNKKNGHKLEIFWPP